MFMTESREHYDAFGDIGYVPRQPLPSRESLTVDAPIEQVKSVDYLGIDDEIPVMAPKSMDDYAKIGKPHLEEIRRLLSEL